MAQLPIRRVSLQGPLSEAVAGFLIGERMSCAATADALAELVVSLSHYHEEGTALFPQVLICDSLDPVLRIIQGQDAVEIGDGPRESAIVSEALKRCAPLAQGGWTIFIERPVGRFRYGVFRQSIQPLALTPAEGLLTNTSPEAVMVLVVQLAENVIELRGSSGQSLEIYVSAARAEDQTSPREPLAIIADAATSGLPPDARAETTRYLLTALTRILQRSKGTLIAVLQELPDPGGLFSSYIRFRPTVDLARRLADYKSALGPEELGALNGAATLMSGALASDGVTIFSTDTKMLAYRAFLSLSPGLATLPGGARRWAFDTLCASNTEQVIAAFYQSHDGRRDCHRKAQ